MQLLRFCSSFNLKNWSTYQIISSRSKHLYKLKMNGSKTAYLHLEEERERFKVSFYYTDEDIGVSRQFNFERPYREKLFNFFARISANVGKVISTKTKKKQKKGEVSPLSTNQEELVPVELFSSENTKVAETESCKDVFFSSKYDPDKLVLKIVNCDYKVAINYPWISNILLPSSIMAGFPVYPSCFQAKYTDNSVSSFVWMKSMKAQSGGKTSSGDKTESTNNKGDEHFIVVGDGFIYTPLIADIGCKLKLQCTPRNASLTGPSVEIVSVNTVGAGPGTCPFEVRHLYCQHKTTNGSLRVVSYNILADVYSSTDAAQNDLFNYCPNYALSIDYRKQLFLKELLGYNGDLICLQEVDTKVFQTDLVPVLGVQGLIGIHAKKSTIREGVATFYCSSKFRLLEVQEVILSQELLEKSYCSHILNCVNQNAQLKERITALGTAALAVVLECLEKPGEVLVVGNTHFYFHPDADHIRLLQSGIFMAFLTHLVDTVKQKNSGKEVSLLCCGDFNSVPECGMYRLMTTKSVPDNVPDWKSKPEEDVQGLSLSQPFNMDSACGTPEYTNYTVQFAACLDYIYYQTDRLLVENVVPLPTGDVLREHRAIPSVVFPSDHVALVAELKWKQ